MGKTSRKIEQIPKQTDVSVDRTGPISQAACVGDGWAPLVELVEVYAGLHNVEILQVKEKFGELRVYVGAAHHWFWDLIDALTVASRHICERCGRPATTKEVNGWLRTECRKCAKR